MDHPFRSLPNVVMTPHLGYFTREMLGTYYGDAIRLIAAFLDGRPDRVVNMPVDARLKKLLRRLGTRLGGSPIVRLLTGGQFAIYSAGNCVSLLGTWMQRIGCSLLVWNMTESTFWLGILAAADLLPTLFIGPFAGAAADRWDTLRLNRICQAVLTAVAALMTILIVCGFLSLTMLIALVALQGCVIALSQPARLALVQELVAREDIPAAVAINSMNVESCKAWSGLPLPD